MAAMAAAAVGGAGTGAAGAADGGAGGWDDARPIDRVEAVERVGDAVQKMRKSVRWCCVDLRRDGGGDAGGGENYGADVGPGGVGGKRRELRGRPCHLMLMVIFVVSGIGRLLLLLLWPAERGDINIPPTPTGPGALTSTENLDMDSRRWRAVLLLHALVLGSLAWQGMSGIGLLGVELREWEVSLTADVHTHGDIRTVEGWIRRGRRYANLGVVIGLCWGTLTTYAIWGNAMADQERAEAVFLWSWPFDHGGSAPMIATLHVVGVSAFLAPLAMLPRMPLALAHAALLRGHRERLSRSFLLDAQGFGGNSRALIVGKASEAAARYRAMCTSVVIYGEALDNGSGLTVALSLDLTVSLLALYLLLVEPDTVGTLWLGSCGILLVRAGTQWPALLKIGASLSRYKELEQALLASSGTTAAAAAQGGTSAQQAAVEEIALQQLVSTQRPAVGLCGGCVTLGWPLLGVCCGMFGCMLIAGLLT